MKNKIFVRIASYRDPELIPTIEDCIKKAKNPELLSFGICYQDSKFSKKFDKDPRFKILKINYKESKGVCWARHQVESLYNKEEFTLQIDSHTRFIKNWDEELIKMWKEIKDPNAILSTYPSQYFPDVPEEKWQTATQIIRASSILKDGHLEQIPDYLDPKRTHVYNAICIAAGFIFSKGSVIKKVPYDPELYFLGEEASLALRLFTNGYNLYHPYKNILWHYYTRSGQKKHWEDFKNWKDLNIISRKRFDCLLGKSNEFELGKYGLGNKRTLLDFMNYSGVDYLNNRLHIDTIEGKEAPVKETDSAYWELKDITFKQTIYWDFNKIDKCNDVSFWAFIFKDNFDNEIYRKDLLYDENKDIVDGNITSKEFSFNYKTTVNKFPKKIIIWPYSKSKTWLNKIEMNLC